MVWKAARRDLGGCSSQIRKHKSERVESTKKGRKLGEEVDVEKEVSLCKLKEGF